MLPYFPNLIEILKVHFYMGCSGVYDMQQLDMCLYIGQLSVVFFDISGLYMQSSV